MIEPILIATSKPVYRLQGKLKSRIWFTSAICPGRCAAEGNATSDPRETGAAGLMNDAQGNQTKQY